jgi:hypothetical protein
MNEPAKLIVPDRVEPRERAVVPGPVDPNATPMQMLAIMTQRGVSMADLKDLVALAKDWEANQARKAFVEAMTLFKAEPHEILKTKFVDIEGGAKFFHATLANVVDGVVASLAKFGLSHKWITDQSNPQQIKVTCVITHRDGHSESTEMVGGPDTTGRKNPIQQVASAQTLMQRYTLLSLCGLASKDMDDEAQLAAKSGKKPPPPEPDGYDNWALNIEAVAEEGTKRLQETWKSSSEVFRNHTVKWEADWWARMKAKAAKVPS